ncbi:hypothetical protein AYL99_10089 [Fonsecaea erecta]|uniref:Peroxisomal membrane protein PEX14 n=1 Tax=Fonsecaea erecta TaxID=1367422 RepID=A0A178Z859_9EURO|nr:hypothetical protein AYL99_10089 [Fonsecaea erecta]OAP55937.1 hypothetical protein AYL99_10089 [Fonsecaea erecta]
MVDQGSRKTPSIPLWQQQYSPEAKSERPTSDDQPPEHSTAPSTPASEVPLFEQAQKSLEDESIRDAPRERKIAFLRNKGLSAEEIEKLLGPEHSDAPPATDDGSESELKTIHDSSQTRVPEEHETKAVSTPASEEAASQHTTTAPKRDIPPIITYPEFLLKPQKPPPLVTFERLAHAAYAFAGVSALTWAASKYIVQPMLESLTEARHDLAETAKTDLETLNKKLESTVSHVPYIPSSAVLQQQQKAQDGDDIESVVSDPTELFHRDVATQTSPRPSRSMSFSSFPDNDHLSAQDPTTSQSSRLRSLHSMLYSLLNSQNNNYSQDRLKDSVGGFQAVLDRLEASHNPFQVDFVGGSFTSYSGPGSSSSATAVTGTGADGKQKKQAPVSEATKFKNEIRSLKGALLSSRNFPTARPAQPFTLPAR